MRRALAGIICLAAALPVFGQTSQPTPIPGQPQRPPARASSPKRAQRQPSSFPTDALRIAADLGLTSDQRKAFDAVLKAMREESTASLETRVAAQKQKVDELKAARREITAARKAGDRKRVAKLKATIATIQARIVAPNPYETLYERIATILTDEQKAQMPTLRKNYPRKAEPRPASLPNRQVVMGFFNSLELSEEQKQAGAQVDEAFSIRMTSAPIFDADEYHEFKLDFVNALAALIETEQRKKFKDLVGDAFFESTPEDRIKSAASRPRFMLATAKKLDLNEVQQKRLATVEKEFAERIRNRKPRDFKANRKLRQALKVAIAKILSDEQLAKFESAIEKRRSKGSQKRSGEGDDAGDKPAGETEAKPKTDKP